MSMTVAAMKGKLGNADYFILAMKAGHLARQATIPSEMEGWDNVTMEEREQREINYNRVKKQIAPYLAKDKDRFFGAIILTAENFDPNNFEPLSAVVTKGLPKLYETEATRMGFLTFTGGEVLIPLDGQHRIKAIQFALDGKDEKSKPIANMRPCTALADEDITVMIVPYDHKKSRKIFTRVNRYAKPTSSADNLMIDDEDYIAISARKMADFVNYMDGEGSADLVKTKGNALNDKEAFFTTLATIAECNRRILGGHFPEPVTKPFIVDEDRQDLFSKKIQEVWKCVIESPAMEEFSDMLADKTESGDDRRREIRRDYLLGKPVPQVCLFEAFVRLVVSNDFSSQAAIERLNKIDWRKNAKLWDRLLISGDKIIPTSAQKASLVIDIIYYVAGGEFSSEEQEQLLADYKKALSPRSPANLPERVN